MVTLLVEIRLDTFSTVDVNEKLVFDPISSVEQSVGVERTGVQIAIFRSFQRPLVTGSRHLGPKFRLSRMGLKLKTV